MKFLQFLAVFTIVLLITGCPYSSEIPLSEAKEKYPEQLIGKWLSSDDVEKEEQMKMIEPEYRKKLTPTYYIISAVDKASMKIEKYEFQSSDSSYSVVLHTAHTTKIGKTTFLNIKPSDEDKYYFYKMAFPDSESLDLDPVTDYIKETFSSSSAMKSYFDKYKDLDFFYSQKEKYKKR